MYEDAKRCWICHRTEDRLRYELPDIMWSIKGDPFRTMYFSANVIDVDKRRDTDIPTGETFYRPNLPDDVSSYYDKGKDAIVLVKRHALPICPLCSALMFDRKPSLQSPEVTSKLRSMRQPGALDLLDDPSVLAEHERLVNNIWNYKIAETQRLEGEFPQAEFKTLMTLYRTDLNAPVTPVMAANKTGLQAPQAVIALKNISQKCPELGNFYDDSSVFVFNNGVDVKKRLEEQIQLYLKNPENLAYLQA
jgi:hypothetical protein